MEALIFRSELEEPFDDTGERLLSKESFCIGTDTGRLHIECYFSTSNSSMLAHDNFQPCDGSCGKASSPNIVTLSGKDEETLRTKMLAFLKGPAEKRI